MEEWNDFVITRYIAKGKTGRSLDCCHLALPGLSPCCTGTKIAHSSERRFSSTSSLFVEKTSCFCGCLVCLHVNPGSASRELVLSLIPFC